VGVLIVTRLIADADKVAHKINALAGREVAVAHHSENKLSASVMAAHDVLVITHQAFMNAAQAFAAHVPDRWNDLFVWNRGARSLIIVDEALANTVDHNAVTSDDLEVALRAVPHHLREQVPLAIKVLETLKVFLDRKEDAQAPGETVRMLWGQGSPKHAEQIRALRGALREVPFDAALYNADAPQTVDGILEDVEVMLDGFAYYYRQGVQHSLNSSRYHLPDGMPGIVILDATAHSNLLYELLEGTVYVVKVPGGIRDYGNVNLHVLLELRRPRFVPPDELEPDVPLVPDDDVPVEVSPDEVPPEECPLDEVPPDPVPVVVPVVWPLEEVPPDDGHLAKPRHSRFRSGPCSHPEARSAPTSIFHNWAQPISNSAQRAPSRPPRTPSPLCPV
jgi:hypothetical protein